MVAPGGDLKKIRFNFAGAEKRAIDGQSDLVLKTAGGDVRLRNPRVYQDIKGQRREIDGRYVLHSPKTQGKAHVGFQVATYDKAKPLIIDPVLVYSTYLGGVTMIMDWASPSIARVKRTSRGTLPRPISS